MRHSKRSVQSKKDRKRKAKKQKFNQPEEVKVGMNKTPINVLADRKAILVLYSPHEVQLQFHNNKARFLVAAWGRQTGKSTAALNDMTKFAWENPNTITWFISPTYRQAKIQFRRLLRMLKSCKGVIARKSETELMIILMNGSAIFFQSGQVLENLRSETLHRVYIDEVRDQHPDLFEMVIYPMLTTTGGSARFISTPNGFDQFYDLKVLCDKDTTGLWSFMSAPSTANPLFTQTEMAIARKTMTPNKFQQEIMAEFLDLTKGKAYTSATSNNHAFECPFATGKLLNHNLPIIVGMDFNLSPMSWVLLQKRIDDFWCFDEIYLEDSNTPDAIIVLVEKLKELEIETGYDLKKWGIIIIGDATANAGQRAAAGQSDYDIIHNALRKAEIPFEDMTPDSNPTVKDRVNTVNMKLKNADEQVNLRYHPDRCPHLKRDFERVTWKDTVGTPSLEKVKDKTLTHISDALGYPICVLSPIKSTLKLPKLRVVKR